MGGIRESSTARILRNHEGTLRSIVSVFKRSADKTTLPAPACMREEAFSGMWQFAGFRKLMRSEVEDMAAYFRKGGDPPDFQYRLARLGLAMYFLERLEKMAGAVGQHRTVPKVALLDMACKGIAKVLDEAYFSKDGQQILGDYLDAEVAFRSCAEACGVQLLTPAEATKQYYLKAADMIDEINGITRPGG